MKKIFLFVFVLISLQSFAQYPSVQTLGSDSTLVSSKGALKGRLINWHYNDTASANLERIKSYPYAQIIAGNKIYIRDSLAVKWIPLGGSDSLITAGTVSSIPSIGDVVGSNITAAKFIQTEFFKSQVPTATLTGGAQIELHLSGTFTSTLNWGAGRQAATLTLSTINVAGTNQTFSQPSQPGTVSGTQNVTVTYNSNVTYTNLVTTTDSKTASATTTYTFLPKRYWGYSNGTPVAADLIVSVGGGNELSNSISKTSFTVAVTSSNQNVYYAYPASKGDLTSIIVGGFESIGAFTKTAASITNASGYTQTYNIYTSNNTFSSTTINFNSVN